MKVGCPKAIAGWGKMPGGYGWRLMKVKERWCIYDSIWRCLLPDGSDAAAMTMVAKGMKARNWWRQQGSAEINKNRSVVGNLRVCRNNRHCRGYVFKKQKTTTKTNFFDSATTALGQNWAKKCDLSLDLNLSKEFISRKSLGNWFHMFGPNVENFLFLWEIFSKGGCCKRVKSSEIRSEGSDCFLNTEFWR